MPILNAQSFIYSKQNGQGQHATYLSIDSLSFPLLSLSHQGPALWWVTWLEPVQPVWAD